MNSYVMYFDKGLSNGPLHACSNGITEYFNYPKCIYLHCVFLNKNNILHKSRESWGRLHKSYEST